VQGKWLDRAGNRVGMLFRFVSIAEILRYTQNDDGKLGSLPPGLFGSSLGVVDDPSIFTFEHQKQWAMSLSGTRDARSNLRQRCRPARQSRPNAPFASCSLCGHSFATRTASSELDNPGSNISMAQILSFFLRKRQDERGRSSLVSIGGRTAWRVLAFPPYRKKRDRMGHPFSCGSLAKKQILRCAQDDSTKIFSGSESLQ
jgi:hypothetical protein